MATFRRIAAALPSAPIAFAGLLVAFALTSADHDPDADRDATAVGAAPAAGVPAAVDSVVADLQTLTRWLTYCGTVAVGSLVFTRLTAAEPADNRRQRGVVVLGAAVVAVGALTELVLFGPIATGRGLAAAGDADLLTTTLGLAHGRLLLAQLCAALALMPVAARLLDTPGPAPGRENLAIGIGLVLATCVAANGHAGGHALVVAVAHTAAMAVWFGSLLAAAAQPAGCAHRASAARLLSRVATQCLSVVVASGTVLAWRMLGSPASLLTSEYGRTLLLKLGVLALLLCTAAVARDLVHAPPTRVPLLARHLTNPPTSVPARLGLLRIVVAAELAIGMCVIAVTAQLTAQAPPVS